MRDEPTRTGTVAIIGGGLAGLAAATALASRRFQVTVVEARTRLGGRASSFTDPGTGLLIDTCQHVSMGCCTNLAHFFRTVGIDHLVRPQSCLYFMTADGRVSKLAAGRWPAPWHLAGSFLRAHYLTRSEKMRIAWGLACLRRAESESDTPFIDWLARHGQTQRTVACFWGLVLTSALNERVERIGVRYARKVFLDGFLRHRRGFEVELPTVPLGRLYGAELQSWFHRHGVRLIVNRAVKAFQVERDWLQAIVLRQDGPIQTDWYIAAVPFDRLLEVLPGEVVDRHPAFANLRRLETSPITSVHLWYNRPVMSWPHLVLIDGIGQWVFNRGELAAGEHYLQVVVSAARQLRGLGHEQIQRQVVDELSRLLPAATPEALVRGRVVTEHAATFSAVPGVDQWRPAQESPIGNLLLAGDWTATGWPATMEGAVRSGYLAAEALLERTGAPERLVQPDLR
jgi:squalene-associated FAD-dependent desaturase